MTSTINQHSAYTSVRTDVVEMVPTTAMKILDVGCSNGALGIALQKTLPGRQVSGIELNPAYAQTASKQLHRVVCANLDGFDWASTWGSERFDCIVFADVLEHLSNPLQCLKAAVQHLESGGCVVISLPNIRHVSAFSTIYIQGRFPRNERGLFDQMHLRWFTFSDALALMKSADLTTTCINPVLRIGDQGGGWLNRRLNRLPLTVRQWWLFREFLGYQICYRAQRSA